MRRFFGPDTAVDAGLLPRWVFLRAFGVIFFSQFFSLAYEIHGLSAHGILPAHDYLGAVAQVLGPWKRVWQAPTLLWLNDSDAALWALVIAGLIASTALVFNLWPRAMIVVCWLLFLSFISAAQEFAAYASDGMLLEAGVAAFFFAPRGLRPRFGGRTPPSMAARYLLLFEWFRIYFESGVAKLQSGDVNWRDMTALDHYYENGPLPTWIGWYVQHLPHWFHAVSCVLVLALELFVVWMMFLPRRLRFICFWIVTPFQIGIILTANYTFLNYLVLVLGVLLLDDRALGRLPPNEPPPLPAKAWRMWSSGLVMVWLFVAQLMQFPGVYNFTHDLPSWAWWPVRAVSPARVANRYHLFAMMTEPRYEIEFQGTRDGVEWKAYPFRFKPQALNEAPGIYAPYQPRMEWNLWFASLGSYRQNEWVGNIERALLINDATVLRLFASNPFAEGAPIKVRAVRWTYRFTTLDEKHATGAWWSRDEAVPYGPEFSGDTH